MNISHCVDVCCFPLPWGFRGVEYTKLVKSTNIRITGITKSAQCKGKILTYYYIYWDIEVSSVEGSNS